MRKIFLLLAVVLWGNTFLYAENNCISIGELFEQPTLYDGKEVVIKGEVIGDIMRDGKSYWINIKENDSCIGIVTDEIQKEQIRYSGKYNVRGDIVKVTGIYHMRCPKHYGERDIHTLKLEVLEYGYVISDRIEIDRVITIIAMGIITIFILLYTHTQHTRKDTDAQ